MNTHNRKSHRSWLGLCIPLLLTLAPTVKATSISLSDTPLFVLNTVKNNIMLVVDNSGSMDFEVLFHANDGGLWWDDSTQSFVNTGTATTDTPSGDVYWSANTKKYYLFPDGKGSGNRIYTSNDTIPPFIQYAFARSSDYNSAYYDPTKTYSPWPSKGSATFSNASTSAAMSDPTVSGSSTFNLSGSGSPYATAGSNTLFENSTQYWDFYMEAGMVMPAGTYYACEGSSSWQPVSSDTPLASGSACSSTSPVAGVRLGIAYWPATYYTKVTTGTYSVDYTSGGTTYTATGSCDTPSVTNYGYFQLLPSTLTATSGTVDALGPDGACLKKVEIKSTTATYTGGPDRTDCAAAPTCTYDEEIQNFANWFQYYRKRHLALRAGMGTAFENLTGTRVGYFTINNLPSATSPITMYDMDTSSDKTTLFDDLYGIKGNNGGTDLRKALNRAGEQYMISTSGAPITDDCQKCFTILFTDGFNSDTSFSGIGNADDASSSYNYSGVAPYKDNYDNTLGDIAMYYYTHNLRSDLTSGDVPIDSSCDSSTYKTSSAKPYADCNPNLHMNTYTVGLDLEGTIFDQSFTDNSGASDIYDSVTEAYDTVKGNTTEGPTWPDVSASQDPRQVDDLYHAAVNGRGEMYNASSTTDIGTKLSAALTDIANKTGSAAAVSFNSTSLSTNSDVYLSEFNSNDWSGNLLAFKLNASDGSIGNNAWEPASSSNSDYGAADALPSASSRVILTYNGTTDKGVAFDTSHWSDLSTAEQDDLKTDTDGTTDNDATGLARLDYIRGDQSCEQDNTGCNFSASSDSSTFKSQSFRDRTTSVLGDIVHSSPVYVGAPDMTWPDTSPFPDGTGGTVAYSTFESNNASRTGIVYVGANDGMVHGFDATTGAEVLAYIPSNLFSTASGAGLHYLTDPSYSHRYYVDLTPSVSDIYDSTTNAWKTILVGGERGGGRGIYALDVTDPSKFTEANAANLVLWEFTSADDPNLGYTFSRPTIALMNNGRWAAIFGNGYNADTSPAPADGKARLFIVFLDHTPGTAWSGINIDGSTVTNAKTGSSTLPSTVDYVTIVADTDTGADTSPNGLATPAVVDTTGDGVPDRVYAGDLDGNLWAFDISSSDPTKWNSAYKTSGSTFTPLPLFTTQVTSGTAHQPITTQPVVINNTKVTSGSTNSPNLLVLFGTGEYLTSGDITNSDTQSFYGIWDSGTGDLTYDSSSGNLQQQTIDSSYSSVSSDLRVVTDTTVNYTGSGKSKQYGWYFNLPDTGERMVTTPLVRDGIVFYNTTVPSSDACSYGGTSWLMSVDAFNGGSSSTAVFHVNGTGAIDSSDYASNGTDTVGYAGQKLSQKGIAPSAATLGNDQYTPTTDMSGKSGGSGINTRTLADISGLDTGRLSWKELGR